MPTRAELLHDTRFQRVTAAIIADAVGRSAVELYGDLEELRLLKVRPAEVLLRKVVSRGAIRLQSQSDNVCVTSTTNKSAALVQATRGGRLMHSSC